MLSGRNSRLNELLEFAIVVLLLSAAQLSAQTYETTYTAETSDNTSACSAQGDNGGACSQRHTLTGTLNNNPVPVNTSKVSAQEMLGSWFTGKIYSATMGWWTKPGHLSGIGYDSQDPVQVRKQIADLKSRGFDGMTMAWSGVNGASCTLAAGFQSCNKEFSVKSFEVWLSEAEAAGNFQVAIRGQNSMLSTYKNPGETDQQAMIRQLQYVQTKYFSSSAYMKIEVPGDGLGPRNIVTFFMGSTTECTGCDWSAIKATIGNNVLFMKQDKSSYSIAGYEGAYSWGPAKTTWSYLDDYINSTKTKPSNLLVWSDASKGFNDEDPANPGHSIWDSTGPKRQALQRCGHRWLDTWDHLTGYQGSAHGLDAVLVPTWNDYEEGTALETGIDNCLLGVINTDLTGNQLTWQDDWDETRTGGLSDTEMEKTVHHYEFYYSNPANDEQLHLFTSLDNPAYFASPYSPPAHALDLSTFGIPCNAKIFVKAVGQPSITNRMTTKTDAPAFCSGTPPYTYINGLELPITDWSTLDDCGGTASCGTVLATSTVHTAPDAVKFSLFGDSPPGSQIGRWLRTVDTSTGSSSDFELDLWTLLDANAFADSAGLVFELSHVFNGLWYHFQFRCDFSSWQVWDELGNNWITTGVPCSRPAQGVYTQFTFHMQRLAGNTVRYKDVQVNGGAPSAINRDFTAETTTWANFNKIGVKLMGNAAMNDYSLYMDDLRLGHR